MSAAEDLRRAWDYHTGAEPSESVLAQAIDAAIAALEAEAVQVEPIGDIRALKYRIHELEGEVIGYKRILDEAAQEPVAPLGQPTAPLSVWRVSNKHFQILCATKNIAETIALSGTPALGIVVQEMPVVQAAPRIES